MSRFSAWFLPRLVLLTAIAPAAASASLEASGLNAPPEKKLPEGALGPRIACLGATSPDNKATVVKESDDTFRLCDARTGKPFGKVMRHGKRLLSAQFHGPYLFSFAQSDPGPVYPDSDDWLAYLVWDATTGEPVKAKTPRSLRGASSLSFLADGKVVAAVQGFGAVGYKARVCDVLTGKHLGPVVEARTWAGAQCELSPDGKAVAVWSAHVFTLWEVKTGKLLGQITCAPGTADRPAATTFVYSWPAKTLMSQTATASGGAPPYTWTSTLDWMSFPGKKSLPHRRSTSGYFAGKKFSPDGSLVTLNGLLYDWKNDKFRGLQRARGMGAPHFAGFSPDGTMVAMAFDRAKEREGPRGAFVSLFDVKTGKALGKPLVLEDVVADVRFDRDSRTFATVEQREPVWDPRKRWGGIGGGPQTHLRLWKVPERP
jgi:WD40 repeat protein